MSASKLLILMLLVAFSMISNSSAYYERDHQFLCRNGNRIERNLACNGIDNCGDLSDEEFCGCKNRYPPKCSRNEYMCYDKRYGVNCLRRESLCNGYSECSDGGDEDYCGISNTGCPDRDVFFKCGSNKCIPHVWLCDGVSDCEDDSDELVCDVKQVEQSIGISNTIVVKTKTWLWNQTNLESATNKWGMNARHLAVALHYVERGYKFPNSHARSEVVYETSLRLLEALYREQVDSGYKISSDELAFYINALLVSCVDPRNFHGMDLVKRLRKEVDTTLGDVNPFLFLTLCNAGDDISIGNIDSLRGLFWNPKRNTWIDVQAMSLLALSCIDKNERYMFSLQIREMAEELSSKQHKDGSFGSLITSALAVQALIASHADNYSSWDFKKAIEYLLDNQSDDGSFQTFLSTIYVIPILRYSSLANISTAHCNVLEPYKFGRYRYKLGNKISVTVSLLHGEDYRVMATINLQADVNSSFFEILKIASTLDENYRFSFTYESLKPHVYEVNRLQNDPVSGRFWFLYRVLNSKHSTKLLNKSPADVIVKDGENYAMWYRKLY